MKNNTWMYLKRRICRAFTLAEALIVIGIIGAVASIVVPSLNNNVSEEKIVTTLQKTYADLDEAQRRAISKYGPMKYWFVGMDSLIDRSEVYANRILENMDVSKICAYAINEGCFANDAVKYKTGTSAKANYETSPSYYKVLLKNDVSLAFYLSVKDCDGSALTSETANNLSIDTPLRGSLCGHIYMDADGPRKGNQTLGKDFFHFWITTNGIYPYGTPYDQLDNNDISLLKSNCFKNGVSCAAWVIKNGNMDYLHAGNTGYCTGVGGYLTWEHTRCK